MDKIEELKEKVEKDPASKLFVPLAEEYRKAGMLDEAIGVLLAGIERQPRYTSAVVSLGKVYFEKGMYAESRAEFEKVVAAVPDNLLAHRKLADIHKELGERDEAIEKYKKVLKLNPIDEKVPDILAELAAAPAAPPPTEEVLVEAEEAFPAEEVSGEVLATGDEEAIVLEEAVEAVEVVEAVEEDEEGLFALSDEEMAQAEEEFAEADLTELEVVEAVEEAEAVAEAVDEVFFAEEAAEEGEVFALSDKDVAEAEGEFEEVEETLTLVDAEEAEPAEEVLEAVEEAEPAEEVLEAVEEAVPTEEVLEAVEEAEPAEEVLEAVEEAEPAEEVLEAVEEAASLDEVGFQDIGVVEAEEEALKVQGAEAGLELKRAEEYVAEGEYAKALNIYRGVLSREPGNQKAQQHLKELQSLVDILGKHEEMLVARLEAFLEATRKRRDEFFRNA